MARMTDKFKTIGKSRDKYHTSIYLEPEEAEALKAISIAQDISLSSVVVNMIRECLTKDEYRTAIQAYQKFKNAIK